MKPCGFCQKIPEKFFICLLVTCVFVYLLVVKAANCIYLLLETLINWLWNEQKPFILFFFKMNGYQMTVSENGLIKQEIKKRFVLLYAKGILIFLQWKLVLFTPMLLVRSTKNACGLIDLFFNKPCSSGTGETKTAKAQHKTRTGKEMLAKNDVTNAEILFCLKVFDRQFSYNCCSDLANLFQCMFGDSEIATA